MSTIIKGVGLEHMATAMTWDFGGFGPGPGDDLGFWRIQGTPRLDRGFRALGIQNI